jgi:DNA-binding response OmpR family regulator
VITGHGAHALAEINANVARFSAIITDIKLDPIGSDGWEIARRARELDPHMPVVYVSGSGADEWPSKGVPNSVMIAKPFAIAQLMHALNLLLRDAEAIMGRPKAAPPLKRSRGRHNQGGKSPVFGKSNRPGRRSCAP